jgi:hypothetical protein
MALPHGTEDKPMYTHNCLVFVIIGKATQVPQASASISISRAGPCLQLTFCEAACTRKESQHQLGVMWPRA